MSAQTPSGSTPAPLDSRARRPPADWDPLSETAVADPFAAHAHLRSRCPVAFSERWGGFWALTRYEDIVAAALDTDTFISGQKTTIPDSTGPGRPPRPPLECDRPQHTQYRRVLAPYFSKERIREWEPKIRTIAVQLLEPVLAEPECDLLAEVALPMPAVVLCAMLQLPSEDWRLLKSWSLEIIDAARSEDAARHRTANDAIYGYVRTVVEDRRGAPRDPEADLITGLLDLRVNGQPLDDDEITGVIRLLLQAGHNTTTNGIGSAFMHLAAHPDAQARLRDRPELIPEAVDEILRAFSPAQLMGRSLARPVEIHGRPLEPGDKVALLWAAANRDPAVFDDPDTVDLERGGNRHVAFGYGIHRCLGADLARTEMRIAIEELLARTTAFHLVGPAPQVGWPSVGPASVPVRLRPA